MASSNTLTGIIPTLYEALNVVSREMVGFIPAVRRDTDVARAAVGQTVRSPIGSAGELEDVEAGLNPKNSGGTTVQYANVTITKSKAAPVLWTGEEQRGVGTTGTLNEILRDQFADAMRKLVNAMEEDLALAAKIHASRAVGTAGSTPFGVAGDLEGFALTRKVLEDNGAPAADLQFVCNSNAMANLRGKQSVLFKVNEAGSNDMLRNGMTDRVQGFALRNSAGIKRHIAGTGASFVTAGLSTAEAREIALAAGTGTILPGDVVTFAADTGNNYVVGAGTDGPGQIVLNRPGLVNEIADASGVTLTGDYLPSFGFSRSSIVLAERAPAMPEGGDAADDVEIIVDPLTGLTFEVALYRQYRRVRYEVAAAWGVGIPNPQHVAALLGAPQ